MKLTLWDYGLMPALIYGPALFIMVFLLTIKLKTGKKQRFFIVNTLTGFIGFAMTFILPFYEPLRFAYTLVPLTFFLMFFMGMTGCLLLNCNPLDVKTPLFSPRNKKAKKVIEVIDEGEKPFKQSVWEANNLIDLLLFKLNPGIHYFKGVQLPINDEAFIEFPFVVTSPTGLFLIYPCNWSGEINFSNNGATKTFTTENDTEDFSTSITAREAFFKQLLDTLGLQNVPVKSIICATNPAAVVQGVPRQYTATELGDLTRILKQLPANRTPISAANLFDLQNAIDTNRIKK